MFGLILAVAWLAICLWKAIQWDKDPTLLTTVKPKEGQPIQVQIPYRPKLRSPTMLALAFALAPFLFVFGNNCFLTIQPAHIAAVYDPLRGGIQKDQLPEGFQLVDPWGETHGF